MKRLAARFLQQLTGNMPRRRTELALRARRGWVWRADAEWRWRRARGCWSARPSRAEWR